MEAHKDNTMAFEELTFAEQAQSLNAQIQNLKAGIIAHRRRAKSEQKEDSTQKYASQLEKLIAELKSL